MSYFGAAGTPFFGFLVTSPVGFKGRVGSAFLHCRGECDVHSLRSTSGATCCRRLGGQQCGALTGFISCPRILQR